MNFGLNPALVGHRSTELEPELERLHRAIPLDLCEAGLINRELRQPFLCGGPMSLHLGERLLHFSEEPTRIGN